MKVGLNSNHETSSQHGGDGDELLLIILTPYFDLIKKGNNDIITDSFKKLSETIKTNHEQMSKVICSDENKTILKKVFTSNDQITNFLNSEYSVSIPHELKECISKLYPNDQFPQKGGIGGYNLSNAAAKVTLGAVTILMIGIGLTIYMTELIPTVLLYELLTKDVSKFAASIIQLGIDADNLSQQLRIIEDQKEKKIETVISHI